MRFPLMTEVFSTNADNGEITVYHATAVKDLKSFDLSKAKRLGDYGPGFYFSTEMEDVEKGLYGSAIYKVVISISKPLVIDDNDPDEQEFNKLCKMFRVDDDSKEILFDGNPLVEFFALLEHAYPIKSVANGLTKLGYDSVHVKNSVINERTPGVKGDYYVIWNQEKVKSIERVNG